MFLKVNFKSETPIYIQVRNQIIQGIARGDIKPGEALPSVRQLASDIGINLHTINKSYNLLKSEGYIVVDRRKGSTILPIKTEISPDYVKNLQETLMTTIASSICNGVDKETFNKICSEIYNEYKEATNNE